MSLYDDANNITFLPSQQQNFDSSGNNTINLAAAAGLVNQYDSAQTTGNSYAPPQSSNNNLPFNGNYTETDITTIPSDVDAVMKIINRITEIAWYLQNYTFAFIYIPGFNYLLKQWQQMTGQGVTANVPAQLQSQNKKLDFEVAQRASKDFNQYANAPYALAKNDLLLFTPYALISTDINIPDTELVKLQLNQGTLPYTGAAQVAGSLELLFLEFMHPVITKYMSYWYSLINTIQRNSYINFTADGRNAMPFYAYITILSVRPDLKSSVAGITFLNCLPKEDPIKQLLSAQINTSEIKQIRLGFEFQSYRRYYIGDRLYDMSAKGSAAGLLEKIFIDMFLPLATITEDEWKQKMQQLNVFVQTNFNQPQQTLGSIINSAIGTVSTIESLASLGNAFNPLQSAISGLQALGL